jgi:hypothetical protein
MSDLRLSYENRQRILARDPDAGQVLLGGLGVMGVGAMWWRETEEHKDYPGYADAEIVSSTPREPRDLRRVGW